jgi:hypothetical protein
VNLLPLFLGWQLLRRQQGPGSIAGDYQEDTRVARRLDRAAHVGAIRPPPPRVVSGSHPAPPPPPAGESPDEAWSAYATIQANTVLMYQSEPGGLGRPAANAQPSDIAEWLKGKNLSPLYLFPEWGWSPTDKPLEMHAAYDLGDNDHVEWWAHLDGSWSYHHVWGGVNFGRALDTIVGVVAQLASLTGWFGVGALLHTAQAIADKKPLSDLANALKQDWTDSQDAGELAFSVVTGDWSQAWDAATKYGQDLRPLFAAFRGQPAPDRNGVPILDQPSPLQQPLPKPLNASTPGLASVSGYSKAPRAREQSKAKRRKRR